MLPSSSSSVASVFSVRLLLAALLLFGSEVLVWTNPPGHTLLDWLFIIPCYLALSAVLLDFTLRYRVRDLFGSLVLAGLYSLAAALLINPQSSLIEMPRTLVTRVMGAHGLLAAEMIGLFLLLSGGSTPKMRFLWIGCIIVGLAWGFWVKGWPVDEGYGEVSLTTMLLYGVGGLALLRLLLMAAGRTTGGLMPETLLLSRQGWGAVTLVLGIGLIIRLVQGVIDSTSLIIVPLLLLLCWAILWFRERAKGRTLLDGRIPVSPLPLGTYLLASALFLGIAVFAYNLPPMQAGDVTPVALIGLGFTAYGMVWLPTVAIVLGARAYLRQIQTRQL